MLVPASSSSSSNSCPEHSLCSVCHVDVVPGADLSEEQSIETRCGHIFHQFCLNRWLASDVGGGKCPYCRQIAFPQDPIDIPQNDEDLSRLELEEANRRIQENVAREVAAYLRPAHSAVRPISHAQIVGGRGPSPHPFEKLIEKMVREQQLRNEIRLEFLSKQETLSTNKGSSADSAKRQIPVSNAAVLIQDPPQPSSLLTKILSYLPWFNRHH